MKHCLFFIVLTLSLFNSQLSKSQSVAKQVHCTYELQQIEKDIYKLMIHATIAEGYSIVSNGENNFKDPIMLKLEDRKGIEFIDEWHVDSDGGIIITTNNKLTNITLKDKAEFSHKIRIAEDIKDIRGSYAFMIDGNGKQEMSQPESFTLHLPK